MTVQTTARPVPAAVTACLATPVEQRVPAAVGAARYLAQHAGFGWTLPGQGAASITVEQALRAGRLDFDVQVWDTQAVNLTDRGVTTLDLKRTKCTVRVNQDGTVAELGGVGTAYTAIVNRTAFAFGEHILGQHGGGVVAVASHGLTEGSNTYVALRLKEGFEVKNAAGEADPYDLYLTVTNCHTGEGGLSINVTPVRRASCTQPAVDFARARQSLKIRHTGNILEKLGLARRAVNLAEAWTEQFVPAAERLLEVTLTRGQIDGLVEELLRTPAGRKEKSKAMWAERREVLRWLIHESPTTAFGRGTAYAVVNAWTEYQDYYPAGLRGRRDPEFARYYRAVSGLTHSAKKSIFARFGFRA